MTETLDFISTGNETVNRLEAERQADKKVFYERRHEVEALAKQAEALARASAQWW